MKTFEGKFSVALTPSQILGIILTLFVIMHMKHLGDPPNGYHQWRESQTAAVALNYFTEDMDFSHPRVLGRGTTNGITGMEFPIYNWAAAAIFHLTGPSHTVLRTLSLLAGCLGLLFLFISARALFGDTIAILAVWATAFSPLYFFYSSKIIPDIITISSVLAGVAGFIKWKKSSQRRWIVLAIAGFTLASLIKPVFLAVFLPIGWQLLSNTSKPIRKRIAECFLFLALPVSIGFAYFQWARQLQQQNHLYEFDLQSHVSKIDWPIVQLMIKHFLVEWPWELWIGWALVPATVAGVWFALKNKNPETAFNFLWFGASFVAIILYGVKSSSHDYSTLLMVPPIAILSGMGIASVWKRSCAMAIVCLLLMLAAPVSAWYRVEQRWGDTGDYYEIRDTVDAIIPKTSLVAVEDPSPAIRLYQLNRCGWTIKKVDDREVESVASAGAAFLLTAKSKDSYENLQTAKTGEFAGMIGPLYCYRLSSDTLPTASN